MDRYRRYDDIRFITLMMMMVVAVVVVMMMMMMISKVSQWRRRARVFVQVQCCFTSTPRQQFIRAIRGGAEDGHLDFLTAPTEQGFSSMLLYVHRDHEDC